MLDQADDTCARMRLEYYDDAGAWMQTRYGGEVCAFDDQHHEWSVDLDPYTDPDIHSVRVSVQRENLNGWATMASSTYAADTHSDNVRITESGVDFGNDDWSSLGWPVGSGNVSWGLDGSDVTPRLNGVMWINNSAGTCARMNLRYLTEAGVVPHRTGRRNRLRAHEQPARVQRRLRLVLLQQDRAGHGPAPDAGLERLLRHGRLADGLDQRVTPRAGLGVPKEFPSPFRDRPRMARRLADLDDSRLAARVHAGDEAAFAELYDRHHKPLLSFCRHMLGNVQDGEDALQQTFIRAHRALVAGQMPDSLRPWLFAIARNRCKTMLAARRSDVPVEDVEPSFDGMSDDVARRADLRELVADLGRLPEDQRGALVLFELGGLSQAEIASAIDVPAGKVKALVFQARTELMAERDARLASCESIREELAVARGGALRRGPLKRHLRQCEPCDAFRAAIAAQRTGLASILPVAPALGLKAAIIAAATSGSGGAAAGVAGGGLAGGLGHDGGGAADIAVQAAGAAKGAAAIRGRSRERRRGRGGSAATWRRERQPAASRDRRRSERRRQRQRPAAQQQRAARQRPAASRRQAAVSPPEAPRRPVRPSAAAL